MSPYVESVRLESGSCGQTVSECRKPRSAGRRMALLRRAGLFGADTKGAVITRAATVDDLVSAYRLVHDAFVEKGYVNPLPSGMRVRVFEALPETATFVAKVGDRVVGVQGLAVDSPEFGLPSDESFKDEIDALRLDGRVVCEATNQAIAPEFRNSAVPTELMRCMFAHALAIGCDELITTISPGHVRFFELLGFEQISPVRSYSKKVEDFVVVMRVNVSDLLERTAQAGEDSDDALLFIKCRCVAGNPYREQVANWAGEAAKTFEDPAALRRLLVDESHFLDQCSSGELESLAGRWGDAVFAQVHPEALVLSP